MLSAVSGAVRLLRKTQWVVLGFALLACPASVLAVDAGQSGSAVAPTLQVSVGGAALRVEPPRGQVLATVALERIYLLHDVSGPALHPLGVYLSPDTARFFESSRAALPDAGLLSTLVVTEKGLEARHVDQRALRDVLVDELSEQRRVQSFLANHRFGAAQRKISLPETRLLTVEDFLVLEGHERLLPESGRRISYCVEAFLGLRNRPVLASTCLTKPDVTEQDMYTLERSVGAWARALLADNPSVPSSDPNPQHAAGVLEPTAGSAHDAEARSQAALSLRVAVDHLRSDVVIATTLLAAQVAPELRGKLEASNERFARNLGSACARAHDEVAVAQCELVAFDRRLRALERCTASSLAPALEAESVERAAEDGPNT